MSEQEPLLIDVTDLKQYHFCPRIVYFSKVLGVVERATHSQDLGKQAHSEFAQAQSRRSTLVGLRKLRIKQSWSGVYLSSQELGLKGLVDMVAQLENGEWILVEYKHANMPPKIPKNHMYQAAGYAMLAEQHFKVLIRRVMIYYAKSNKVLEFELSDGIRKHVKWSISKIRRILESEELPRSRADGRCASCGYMKVCQGV